MAAITKATCWCSACWLLLWAGLLAFFQRVLSKTMILEHVWDYAFDPKTNVVDVLVCRLRNKIDREFDPKLIHTLRGFGYALKLA